MKRSEIVEYARTLVGEPFRHMGRGGRDGRVGFDCGGVILAVCNHFGIECRDIVGSYSLYPTGGMIEKLFAKFLNPIDKDDVRVGSVVLMYHVGFYKAGVEPPQHAYIVSSVDPYLTVIQANDAPSLKKVTESTIKPSWNEQVCYRYDFPGVEDG